MCVLSSEVPAQYDQHQQKICPVCEGKSGEKDVGAAWF